MSRPDDLRENEESPAGANGELKRTEPSDLELPADALRWRCDPGWLPFESTASVEPARGVVGQDDAIDALRFGLEFRGEGQNIYVRGLAGTGRSTLVEQLIEEIRPKCRPLRDRCYVHDFERPERPRLITLDAGRGQPFCRRINELIDFITGDLPPLLGSDEVRSARRRLDDQAKEKMRRIGDPLEKELREAGLALVPVQEGMTMRPVILPVMDGEPVQLERLHQMRLEGNIPGEEADALLETIESYVQRFEDVSGSIREIQEQHRAAVQKLFASRARAALQNEIDDIAREFPDPAVAAFLGQVAEDLVGTRLRQIEEIKEDFTRLYRVNPIATHGPSGPCPVVIEGSPSARDLIGHVDRQVAGMLDVHSDHTMIRAGSLLRADGGFIVLEARDVLAQPGAWQALVRTLRTGSLEIGSENGFGPWSGPTLNPEPIPIDVKVVLIGDPGLYYLLDAHDLDFPNLFKALVDFDTSIARDEQGARAYAAWISRRALEEKLLPFSKGAVAALVEHGARIAARKNRLTARFGRLADLAREAAHGAAKAGRAAVLDTDVRDAVKSSKRRADLPARAFRRHVQEGTIRIRVDGSKVGQVNGLAVIHAGPLTYGFPTRITATVGAGTAGAINIERESQLSGAIHTKAFYILGGLLRHLLRVDHPLAFSASIAFEQSYGGIDGDSASGAEICCLLSALTDVPLRQGLAMTGAIDQLGAILPVGAVTEKVEGFFDTCSDLGLTGEQGVLVPKANAGDMTLRPDVIDACRSGRFHVYAVDHIAEAIEMLTGHVAGERNDDGHYPAGTVLGLAEKCAGVYWMMASGMRASEPDAAAEDVPEAD